MAASVKDVAEAAGVSLGTVSNVLNHPERVGEKSRLRVEQAIRELQYVRNDAARQLRSGNSRTIAVILPDTWNPFFNELARGIEDAAAESGWSVLAANTARDPKREEAYLSLFSERRVDGMIVLPTHGITAQLAGLPGTGIATVLADYFDDSADGVFVSFDDLLGGQLAMGHLLELGHRRVAFAGTTDAVDQVKDRYRGAVAAASAAGVEITRFVCDQLSLECGREIAGQILALPIEGRPTAVFAANDLLALGMLQALLGAGIRVPGDIALIGYDDIDFARYAAVPLSSVVQPAFAMGREAARLLFAQLRGEQLETSHVVFEPRLVVRQSTADAAPQPESARSGA